jgi:carotenoid 1,2-hydratase
VNLLSGVKSDFHHPQKNPGAYEWWHFDGTDHTSGYSFSAQFYAGHLLSPYYQESLKNYWREAQSPLVASPPATTPPNPLDFTGVTFRIFKKGALINEFLQEYKPGQLKASDRQPAFLLGSNRFNWEPAGNPASYTVTLQGAVKGGKRLLRARLFFTPGAFSIPPLEPPEITSTHTWILAAPRCHVEGTLQWCNAEGDVQTEVPFLGNGYHDHHFGTVPLDRFVKAWHWGRAFLGEKTIIYSVQSPMDEKEGLTGILLLLGGTKLEAFFRTKAFQISQKSRNFFWLPYQKKMSFSPVPSLTDSSLVILRTQTMGDGPVSLIFEDELSWSKSGQLLKGIGMSNYIYTPRLSSRFFFPMLKGKTTLLEKPRDLFPPSPNQPGGDVLTTRPDLPQ